MDSKRPKTYKRSNVNSSNETAEMVREDGKDMITGSKRDMRNRHIKTEAENIPRRQTDKHTGRDDLRSRRYSASTVCLAVLCVALLTAVIVMGANLYQMIEEFYEKNKNFTDEIKYLKERQTSLQTNVSTLSEKNSTEIKNNKQLQETVTNLMGRWKCYQSSLYFISSEVKSWNMSMQDCMERGSYLTIISSKEEQEFLKTASGDSKAWIGLTYHVVESKWRWIDGSVLNTGFWKTGEPDGSSSSDENCAINLSSGFEDYSCDKTFKYICERPLPPPSLERP